MLDLNYINKYLNILNEIPNKREYSFSDLLINDLLIESENDLNMYYAPLDYINNNAKIVIVGITPGFTQMEIAIRTYKKEILLGKSYQDIIKIIKQNAAFAGQMRKNLVNMMDELEINKKLNIKTCDQLFDHEYSYLTHMTSLLKYPVFKNKKNYTGYSPEISKSKMLKNTVEKMFLNEIKNINYSIIIPLGDSVSKVLEYLLKSNNNIYEKCLCNFPHPSGANGHRLKIFYKNKNEYIEKINKIL